MMSSFSVITPEDAVISMPRFDGIEMTRRLRIRSEFERVPIVVPTAHRSGNLTEAMHASATRTMYKPVVLDSLIDGVKDLLPGH